MRELPIFPALLLLAVAAASPALAQLPPYANSLVPTHVNLVGWNGVSADSAHGRCTVEVRNLANEVVPGVPVTLDFSSCTDLRVAADQHDPRLVVGCSGATVTCTSDAQGIASFTIVGASYSRAASTTSQRAMIDIGGSYAGNPPVAAFDLDGSGGLTLLDLSLWGQDYFSATNPSRSDYDGNGVVSLLDLSAWSRAYFAGGSLLSGATYCP